MEKLNLITSKINKYTHLEFTIYNYITIVILGIIVLLFLFLFFDNFGDLCKNNIIQFQKFSFKKLNYYIIIPILAIVSLFINPFNNVHLNDWMHFIALFFISPLILYLFTGLCILLKLLFIKIYKKLSKREE